MRGVAIPQHKFFFEFKAEAIIIAIVRYRYTHSIMVKSPEKKSWKGKRRRRKSWRGRILEWKVPTTWPDSLHVRHGRPLPRLRSRPSLLEAAPPASSRPTLLLRYFIWQQPHRAENRPMMPSSGPRHPPHRAPSPCSDTGYQSGDKQNYPGTSKL